jgi:glycosyltransferase involved in cell wall biosynthesis
MINVSGSTFIRNAFDGGFALFESMATVLAVVDEFHVVDYGSTDGTLQILQEIANKNKRIKIHQAKWSSINPAAFADAANHCVSVCPTEAVLFYQADEIFHQKLMQDIKRAYENKEYALTFERIQLSHNFNQVRWLPHLVTRSIVKGKYVYDKDGMTVSNAAGTIIMCRCPIRNIPRSSRKKGWSFPWHNYFDKNDPRRLNHEMAKVFPWDEFLVDTSSSFRDNAFAKKELHAPFWNESGKVIDSVNRDEWMKRAMADPVWTVKTTPFPLPNIAKGLVGMVKYSLRDEVRKALENDDYSIVWGKP